MPEEIRRAEARDTQGFRELWELCFQDSGAFLDFFFRERFDPSLGVCAIADGRVVGSVHGWPFALRLRGVGVPCRMYSGVCVHPDFRGRGLMRRMMKLAMEDAAAAGIPLLILRPVDFSYYAGLGFLPSGRMILTDFTLGTEHAPPLRALDPRAALDELYDCYRESTAGYANCVLRSRDDMARKCAEYAADGGQFWGLYRNGSLEGYCVCFSEQEGAQAEEVAARTPADCGVICAAATAQYGKPLRAKLPPDVGLPGTSPRPYHAMTAGSVSALLAALGPEILGGDFRAALRDPTIPENNGVWDAWGQKTAGDAPVALSAGRLVQWLSGYADLESLAAEPDAEIRDAAAAEALSRRFPPLLCWTADEY